jgi:hypothetical protein
MGLLFLNGFGKGTAFSRAVSNEKMRALAPEVGSLRFERRSLARGHRMNHYEFISKGMLVSPTARRIYRVAAALSLTIYLSLPAILMNGPAPFLKQLLFVGVVGMALTIVGMEVFLFRFDDSSDWKQMFWFCAMFFVPLGPALYCFLVYSGSGAVMAASVNAAETLLTDPKPKV